MASKIPVIDIAPLVNPQKSERTTQKLVKDLYEALHSVGFFYIQNHGIPDEVVQKLLNYSKEFFALPKEQKMQIDMKNAGLAWRGFFPVGAELTSGKPDKKEGLYFGKELELDHPAVLNKTPLHGQNQWPRKPDFKPLILDYMARMTKLGHQLMNGIALSLGLDEAYFLQRFTDDPTVLLRIFNYPQHIWENEADEWGVREHTDMGFLTILFQDKSGGLQVKGLDNQWIEAPPINGTFVVNIGDMLEVWTKGIYRATPHRVRNQGTGDRISIPFFFDPNWNANLRPIPEDMLPPHKPKDSYGKIRNWDGVNLSRLTDITYGEFVWSKVKTVFPWLV
jgi:isopenicillin N synthase-like dioxygenase